MPTIPHKIPVNIITGFLGVGKTTAILNLLRQQRSGLKWAVLVNEFGEIGIDGALLESSGFAIREVPGGCMCCVAGVPTRIALNRLIREAQPDRILIEPTGLGHPANILGMLHGQDYTDVLDVRATLTLIDPRVLQDIRYTGNENFLGQLQAADLLVANKADLCTPEQLAAFRTWAGEQRPDARIEIVQQGALDPHWLDLPSRSAATPSPHALPSLLLTPQFSALQRPADQPMVRRENSSAGFFSCGWIFAAEQQFNSTALFQLLNNLDVLRCKAVMRTERGTFAFNLLDGNLTITDMPAREDSRIEFIAPDPIDWNLLQTWLLQTRVNPPDQSP